MRISRIEIQNYRSIESATIEFDRLTAIVGRNGAGKSTALNALALFYSLSAQVTEHDYFNCDTSKTIRIAVTYNDLTADEIRTFGSYVNSNSLTVAKVITTGGSVYKGTRCQIPEFSEVRTMSYRAAAERFRELASSGNFPGLQGPPRSHDLLLRALDEYEARHPERLVPVESDGHFLGPTNVGGGTLDNFTKFVRVPAVRDAAGELDRKGAVLQLLDLLVLRSISARPEVRRLNEEFEAKVREIYSKENIIEIDALARSVTELLRRYAPEAAFELDFASVQPPKVPTPQPVAALIEDDFRCPVTHTGHGLQRALIFALLEKLALTEAAHRDASESMESEENSPCLILAIEEPELYLHPPRSRFLARTLRALALSESSRTQVCYTTHSPFYVGLDRFDQIRIARKEPSDSARIRKTSYFSFSRANAAKELQRLTDGSEEEFTAESFTVRASPVMTSAVNEGFFADAVVIVEGLSDAAALTTIQELLELQWDEKGIVVVPALGKANIDRPTVVFRGFGIPTYFIFDGDTDLNDSETKKRNLHLLRLAGADEVDVLETRIESTWAVFKNNLEDELSKVDQKFFLDERSRLASDFGYTKSKGALKNPELTALYVQRAHGAGKLPQSLIDLAVAITKLATGDS
jgi:putative ATP-dependent endonuclease of OLD family